MKIEKKDYPYVEPVKKIDRTDNAPERRTQASVPEDRVEISEEAKLRIELGQIHELMQKNTNDRKAYAVLFGQYQEVKRRLEQLELEI